MRLHKLRHSLIRRLAGDSTVIVNASLVLGAPLRLRAGDMVAGKSTNVIRNNTVRDAPGVGITLR